MASKPQIFPRMEFSLVIYWVLKQLGLACRPAPPCLVLPSPGFPLGWSYHGRRLRGHILGPSLLYTYVNDSFYLPPQLQGGCSPWAWLLINNLRLSSLITCQADWAWLRF